MMTKNFLIIFSTLIIIVRGHSPTSDNDGHGGFIFRRDSSNTFGTMEPPPWYLEPSDHDEQNKKNVPTAAATTTPSRMYTPPKNKWPYSFQNHTRSAYQLHNKLFRDCYIRRLVKPASAHTNGTLDVKIGLALIQLIDIDELNQVMTTNVWLYQEWQDNHFAFDPDEYNGIRKMDVPAHMIWLPDIVLYNSADGQYAVPPCLRVRLRNDGTLQWDPPVIYRSFCQIDIQWFPFDRQNCSMKFGSWTYDGLNINLTHQKQREFSGDVQIISEEDGAFDFENFRENTEWTVTGSSAQRTLFRYSCCPTPYIDVTFYLVVTRKPLFILVNLLFPCFIISFLSVFVFYLPAQSGEKMSLSVSILVALIMFFLVIFEKIPATSLSMPLFAKFLIFTLVLVTLSIVLNVAIIRIHWLAIEYIRMPRWIRRIFLEILAPRLFDPDPNGPFLQSLQAYRSADKAAATRDAPRRWSSSLQHSASSVRIFERSPAFGMLSTSTHMMSALSPSGSLKKDQRTAGEEQLPKALTKFERELIDEFTDHSNKIYEFIQKRNVALETDLVEITLVSFVSGFLTLTVVELDAQVCAQNEEEWRVVALVVDRIFFCIFVVVFSTGTVWIFWHALFSTIFLGGIN